MTLSTALFLSLLAHLVGDYLLQTDWMASQKTSQWLPAIVHGLIYTIPFLIVTQAPLALLVIGGTHIIIDRFRLARHLVWFKNQLAPADFRPDRSALKTTGYAEDKPIWLSTWLMIIADNTIHLIINTLAIVFLGQIALT